MKSGVLRTAPWPWALLLLMLLARPAAAQEDLFGVPGLPGSPGAEENFSVTARLLYPEQAPGGRTVAEVRFACSADFYVWHESIAIEVVADPVEGAAGAGVVVPGIEVGRIILPEPKEKFDKFAGGAVRYLDGEFTATAILDIAPGVAPGDYDLTLDVRFTGCGPDICQFPRHEARVRLTVLSDAAPVPIVLPEGATVQPTGEEAAAAPVAVPAPAEPVPAGEPPEGWFAGRTPLVAVLVAYLVGLALTFTPCVYPLIPVTVSLIGATAGGRRLDALVRSLVYVFGISVTYSIAGVAAAATGGMFGAWAQHPAVYLVLAVLFVLLAGAMLDLYAIDISSQRMQRLQVGLRGRAGLVGIWLIGLLSGAAATACIAPLIVGAFAYVLQHGSLTLGWLIFFAMAWGMGTPLVVLGTFTGLLKALPRSGEWMVAVKRVFGLALLGVAVWFVGKSRVLPDLWFRMLAGSFLLGAGVFVGAFGALGGKSDWRARARKVAGLLLLAGALVAFFQAFLPGASAPAAGPAGVEWVKSEETALAQAAAEGKPVLLDFWADWCAPCHRMFAVTFRDPRVIAESRRFVCAKVDLTDWSDPGVRRVRQKYGVWAAPTVVLVRPGSEPKSFAGYLGPDEMLAFMRSVR